MQAVLDLPQTKNYVDNVDSISGRIIFQNISWETYECFLKDLTDKSNVRINYNNGRMEFYDMEGIKHGKIGALLSEIISQISDDCGLDFISAGNTTFKKEKKKKGFEPDDCFYFENASLMRTVNDLDLEIHPAPELIIEIDITSLSLPRFPIFAAIGVSEVWRFDGETVKFHRLQDDETYIEIEESVCLPKVKSESVTKLLEAGFELPRKDWLKMIRESV